MDGERREKMRARFPYYRTDVRDLRVRGQAEDASPSCRCWKVDARTENRSEGGAGDATKEQTAHPDVRGTR